jgi:hypothetical protein
VRTIGLKMLAIVRNLQPCFNYPIQRVRAANLLTVHPETKIEDTCARGGWYMESVSKAFAYIKGILESISRAGKALSGWRRPMCRVQQPKCVFIIEGNVDD